jgi:hypothetical protein
MKNDDSRMECIILPHQMDEMEGLNKPLKKKKQETYVVRLVVPR